ncbi:MAG: hypothetical protein LQ342_002045 [Letrouitia transgressa]|nr:MAG: hypothetical protein LQ342_002045 [Letrouitia transgressa]
MEHEVQLETLESKADRLFSGNDDVEVWKSDGVDLELNNKLKREQFSWVCVKSNATS